MGRVIPVPGISNQAFLNRHARPGCIGLAGGSLPIDRAIRKAQRLVRDDHQPSDWSHAFLFTGKRLDGRHWVLESDLDLKRKTLRLGVQENRADQFHDVGKYPVLGVMDLGLDAEQVRKVLTEGLELLSQRTMYSLRELAGTLLAMKKPGMRSRENPLARKNSLYCSAFVRHCFRAAGLDLTPGLSEKNTTPEDLTTTPLPHTLWVCRQG